MGSTKKLTVEFSDGGSFGDRDARRWAIDRMFDEQEVAMSRLPKITIRVGFEAITLNRAEFGKMLHAVAAAEATGSEYPEDWARFYGLGDQS